jgi:hypothetical protein
MIVCWDETRCDPLAKCHPSRTKSNLQHLYISCRTSEGDSFVRLILRQVDAIKFAFDWKKKGKEKGGKKFKSNFTTKIYEARTGRTVPTCHEQSEDDNKAFKTFRSDYQHVITSRNYLLDMYEEVHIISLFFSSLIHCIF